MNFFEHQAKARSQSKRLVVLFLMAVAAIVVSISTVAAIALEISAEEPELAGNLFTRHTVGATSAGVLTLVIITLASLYKIAKLRSGGGAVARQLGGTLVSTDVGDPAYRRLRNVVEEIAIASGVPVPEIYVLEDETGINAFAAGYVPADAAITVTRGALEALDRDELQGVIAHEFSHVLNGDMRLNIKLMGVLFGILVLSIIGREVVLNSRGGGKSKDGGMIILIAIGVMVIGYIGLFFGRLIKAGLSRQREFLADASAVQFTRQNRGIAGALRKIGSAEQGSKLETADAEEVSHMLFGDGVGYSRLFATHPALEERIARIDPRGDTKDRASPKKSAEPKPAAAVAPSVPDTENPAIAGFAGLPPALASIVVSSAQVSSQVGNPAPDDYRFANDLGRGIPDSLRKSAHVQDQAPALVLALALGSEAGLRDRQLQSIASQLDEATREQVAAFAPEIAALHPMQRLPLAAIAFPALRRKPRNFLQGFIATLDALIHADGEVQLAEYCLARLVTVQVIDSLDPSKSRVIGRKKLRDLKIELAIVMAILAARGHDTEAAARQAYVAGMHGLLQDGTPPYFATGDAIAALDKALPPLNSLDPAGKQLVVEALTRVMSHDGAITVAEAELLRTICASLHCPLPPMLATAA